MKSKHARRQNWDPLAAWYDGWMGQHGSRHHRRLAIPAVLSLLALEPGQHLLDLGAGQGVLAPYVAEAGARFTGVEISPKLVSIARKRHGLYGTFIQADVRRLSRVRQIKKQSYDACVFLLSLQDMEPLQEAIQSAAWALKSGGRLVALLTHPCFRVPRQSGWGWDEGRKLRYRRIDRYLTEMEVPMKKHPGRTKGVSRSYHRPLSAYVNELVKTGLFINQVLEIPCDLINHRGKRAKAHRRADQEFPLFMGLRAVKSDWP